MLCCVLCFVLCFVLYCYVVLYYILYDIILYFIMGPLSCLRSIVDRNVVMRRIPEFVLVKNIARRWQQWASVTGTYVHVGIEVSIHVKEVLHTAHALRNRDFYGPFGIYRLFATKVSQLKFWHFWVTGIERNVCRCTFNRYTVLTQFAKLAAGEQSRRRCTHRKLQHFKTFESFSWKITHFELWHCCGKWVICG